MNDSEKVDWDRWVRAEWVKAIKRIGLAILISAIVLACALAIGAEPTDCPPGCPT